jgi:3-oxoacyl-[acyl-carrier-protein] synthase II
MSRPRVVITGMGAITGFGFGWRPLWDAMLQSRHCVVAWQPAGIDGVPFPVRFAAPVDPALAPPGIADDPAWALPLEWRARLGCLAADLAFEDSALPPAARQAAALVVASGAPRHRLADMQLAFDHSGDRPGWPQLYRQRDRLCADGSLRQSSDRLARAIADRNRCRGPLISVSSACAGATQAIGNALQMIHRGEVQCAIAGGADSVLSLETMAALLVLGAPSTERRFGTDLCRPFDRGRSGLVAGEGAGFVVLETLDHALQRDARIHAELLGYGSSLDGYKLTAPDPSGAGAARAMQAALQDAGVAADEVDLVNAHGTSTPLNDVAETRAIRQVFERDRHYRRLAVTANKSQFGHLIAAAGAPELIATALSCRDDRIPPTLNLHDPDPECDLDYCAQRPVAREVRIALSNSFGFGGLNASLVVGKYAPGAGR